MARRPHALYNCHVPVIKYHIFPLCMNDCDVPVPRVFSIPDLPNSIIILNVTASSNARRSNPVMRCTLSRRYTSVLRCMYS